MPRKIVKKAKRTVKEPRFKVAHVGRFDDSEGLKDVVFDDGETVGDILRKANISLSSGEEVNNLDGEKVSLDSKIKNGDSLVITSNSKSGN